MSPLALCLLCTSLELGAPASPALAAADLAAPSSGPARAKAPGSAEPGRIFAEVGLGLPVHLAGTLGMAVLAAQTVSAGAEATLADRLQLLQDRDGPAQLVFATGLVTLVPLASSVVVWLVADAAPGFEAHLLPTWAAGALGQLLGLGIVVLLPTPTGVVLGALVPVAAEVTAAQLTRTEAAPPAAPGVVIARF